MNIVAAVDRNWGIGYRSRLLVSIPADMKFVQRETMGKIVVMGRKTLESLPNGRPLPMRTTFVLTSREHYSAHGAEVCHSLEELLSALSAFPSEDIYILGGESVYRQMLPYCDTVHLTKIDHVYQADAHFPDIDKDPAWVLEADSEEQTYFDLEYTFLKYRRISDAFLNLHFKVK